jgi:DMSO/TMAO reductase YedYZ molybdopterin-dependent catalytic subunit
VPTGRGVAETHGLTSCTEWTGVPLSLPAREAGVQRDAAWILAEGADGSGNERSLPLAKAMDDALIAYGRTARRSVRRTATPCGSSFQAGAGNINVKWLRRLKVVDRGIPDADGRHGPTHPAARRHSATSQLCTRSEVGDHLAVRGGSGCGVRDSTRSEAWRGRVEA